MNISNNHSFDALIYVLFFKAFFPPEERPIIMSFIFFRRSNTTQKGRINIEIFFGDNISRMLISYS